MSRVILEVYSGRQSGVRRVIASGDKLTVGRTQRADLIVPEDSALSDRHFSVTVRGERALVQDERSKAGTRVNGELLSRIESTNADVGNAAEAASGSWIRAGKTDFMLYHERRRGADQLTGAQPPNPVDAALSPVAAEALSVLAAQPLPLFGIFDAARDPAILPLLRESVDAHACLYTGPQARALEDFAPYLVAFRDDSDLFVATLKGGWGNRWGIYLSCARPFKDVRTHFRRLLIVKDEETNKKLYFRFYDPATLRVFLRTSRRWRSETFFGPIACFFAEDETGRIEPFIRDDAPLRSGAAGA